MGRTFVSARIHPQKRALQLGNLGPVDGWEAEIVIIDERHGPGAAYFHSDETVTVWFNEREKLMAYLEEVTKDG